MLAGWLARVGEAVGRSKEGDGEREREGESDREREREGGRDCALSCRESHGVPDWRKMSKDCSSG